MKNLFQNWIFEHSQYASAFNELKAEITRALDGSAPFISPLLGDSRTGKTALLKDIYASFESQKSSSQHHRVMSVSMPSTASNEALAERIIQGILGPIDIKGRSHQVIEQARQCLTGSGVQVLLIDEMNHLVEKRSTARAQTKDIRHAADWFKELCDVSGISIVFAGLPHVERIYADNDQLANRGLVSKQLFPYAWSVQSDRRQYLNLLAAAIGLLQENGWSNTFDEDRLARISYFGSGGYVGRTTDFFARLESNGNQKKVIDESLIARTDRDKFKLNSYGDPTNLAHLDDVLLNAAHIDAKKRALHSEQRAHV